MKNKGIQIAGLSLLVTVGLLMLYANTDLKLFFIHNELNKNKDLKLNLSKTKDRKVINSKQPIVVPDIVQTEKISYDTSKKRVLLVGDSQAEGLMYPLNNYLITSGHNLAYALSWYSASDRTYASNDTLKHIIAHVKPNYIILVIGLNQIFQTSFEPSRIAVTNILNTIGDIPFSWIGPANWVEDKGINSVYEEMLPKKTFFLSKNIVLPRGGDGRHPNNEGYRIWMDSVANWLKSDARWNINIVKPIKAFNKHGFKFQILNVARRKTNELKKISDSALVENKIDSTEN
jgi:hypothetical protein